VTRRRLRSECLAVALLAILVTLPFVDVLFSDARFYVRDLTRYYYPTKKLLRDIVLNGEFPQWNRFYSAGQPIAANPEYEVFYPLQWLILLPDYDLGYRLHILVHIYVAAIGMYVLLRSIRLRIAAALLGAVAFATGGVFISYVNLLPILFAAAWIPWVGWLLLRALERATAVRVAAPALVLGIQALVGEPTTLIQTWGMALLLGVWLGWVRGRFRGVGRAAAITTLILVLGFCGGAVQLLTAADHVGDSARSRGFKLDLVTTWSMHPARPLELVFPHVFGHLFGERTYWGSGMYRNTASPFIFSIYLGLPIIVFAAAAMVSGFRGRFVAVLVMIGSVLLALGEHTPLYRILYELGIARSVRYPEKFLFPGLVCLILLGAYGFDRFLRRDRRVRRIAFWLTIGIATISLAILIVMFTPAAGTVFDRVWGISDTARQAQLIPIARQDWILAWARGSVFAFLLWGASRWRSLVGQSLVTVFLVIELLPVGIGVLPRIDRSYYDEPSIAGELDRDRTAYRLFHEIDWYGRSKTARKYFATGERAYQVIRNGMYPMTPALWGFQTVLERDYDKTALLPTLDLLDAMWQVRDAGQKRWREIFGAMSNVRYRSTYRPFEKEEDHAKEDPKSIRPVEFVRTEEQVPRYYLADEIVQLKSKEEFAPRLVRETFSPRVAFVGREAFEPAGGKVLDVKESANGARIVVEADGQALLVASVTRHRYWSATLDGKPTALEPVNLAYQGVVLGEGRHEVVMTYRNPLIVPLGAFSFVILAGCAAIVLVPVLRSRSRTISS